MTAVSVTRSTFDLTISPSWIFESVPSYSRVIFSISSDEYSSSRPERTRSCERGGLRVGRSSSNSSTSRASTSMRYTGLVFGLRLPRHSLSLQDSVCRAQASACRTGGNLPREPLPRQFNYVHHLLFQRQGRRIQQNGVWGRLEGCDPAVRVGGVPGGQRLAFAPYQLDVHRLAALRQPAPGPLVWSRRQKDLQRGLGKNHRADISPVHNHAPTTATRSTPPPPQARYPGPAHTC